MKTGSVQSAAGLGESRVESNRIRSGGNDKEFLGELQRVQGSLVSSNPSVVDGPRSLKFSAHAIDRMQSRGIRFDQNTMQKIEDAVAKASEKGAKDTLVIAGEQALIVSVKNQTVVTVMDRASMRENVFTNIDSTVMI